MSGKRPRRAHGAVDRLPEDVREQVHDWLVGNPDRLTYRQISEELAEMGHKISPSQICRYAKRFNTVLERHTRNVERAEVILKRIRGAGTDLETATTAVLKSCILEAIADASPQTAESINDLVNLAHAAGSLQRAQVARERLELVRRKAIKEAVAEIKASLTREIEGQPELLEKLLELAEECGRKLVEEKKE